MTIIVTQKDYVRIKIGFAREHTECREVLGTFSRNWFGAFIQVRIAVDGSLLPSFAKFRHFSTLQMPSRILCPFCYSYGSFSTEFLTTTILYLCFAICTGVSLNDVKLGILILIRNMALKMTS